MNGTTWIDRRSLRRACVASVVVCIVGAWLGLGDSQHAAVRAVIIALALLPLGAWILALGIWSIAGRAGGRARNRASLTVGACGLILLVGVVASWYVGAPIGSLLKRCAKSWALEQVPAIERYRAQHGEYPAQLSDAVDLARAPRLVRDGEIEYIAGKDHFAFVMGGMFSTEWYWTSAGRER